MRRLVLLIVVGLASITGCAGSHQEVRVESSVPVESTQDRLDTIAANLFNGLFGGLH